MTARYKRQGVDTPSAPILRRFSLRIPRILKHPDGQADPDYNADKIAEAVTLAMGARLGVPRVKAVEHSISLIWTARLPWGEAVPIMAELETLAPGATFKISPVHSGHLPTGAAPSPALAERRADEWVRWAADHRVGNRSDPPPPFAEYLQRPTRRRRGK